jgi:hypothetical protein
MPSKNKSKNTKKQEQKNTKEQMDSQESQELITPLKKDYKEILTYDKGSGYLIPNDWKYPYFFNKKNYIAIIIGLNQRYEYERVFCEKIEFEINEELKCGYEPSYFRDNLILEERYTYKEHNTFISKTNYYKIQIFEQSVWGKRISKRKIRETLKSKQLRLYEEIRELMENYGEYFTLYTMNSIIKKKKKIRDKYSFFNT